MSDNDKMNDGDRNGAPDPREALLPWYATGRLSAEDEAAVRAWLDESPTARRRPDMVGEEIDAILAGDDAIDPPSARMLDRLMADIDALEGPQRAGGGATSRLLRALTGWMPADAPTGLRLAGIAAALVIFVQAAALGWLVTGEGAREDGFRTASGPVATAPAGAQALVAFQDTAKAGDIAALLRAAGADIVDGPREGGIFGIRFASATLSAEEQAAAIAALRARGDIVRFVAEAR